MTGKQARFVEEYVIDFNGTKAAIRADLWVIEAGEPPGFYVYGLLSPDGRVFYVGKGQRKRWMWHYSEKWGPGNHRKRAAIAACKGHRRCVVLGENLTEPETFTLERELIAALPGLTNLYPGQRSEKERTMEEADEILAMLTPFDRWINKAPRTEAEVSWYRRIMAELADISANGAQSTCRLRRVNGGPTERFESGEWRVIRAVGDSP